jgi:hypothetical protein
MTVLGVSLGTVMVFQPEGFAIGSIRWQPIFLSPILVILGALGWLASVAVRYASPIASSREQPHKNGNLRSALRRSVSAGLVLLAAGASAEFVLAVVPVSAIQPPDRRLALASLAASLLLVGAVLAAASAIAQLVTWQRRYLGDSAQDGSIDASDGSGVALR